MAMTSTPEISVCGKLGQSQGQSKTESSRAGRLTAATECLLLSIRPAGERRGGSGILDVAMTLPTHDCRPRLDICVVMPWRRGRYPCSSLPRSTSPSLVTSGPRSRLRLCPATLPTRLLIWRRHEPRMRCCVLHHPGSNSAMRRLILIVSYGFHRNVRWLVIAAP